MESIGSSLSRDGHCVGTLIKTFTHNCSALSIFSRMVVCALLNFGRRAISHTVVLYDRYTMEQWIAQYNVTGNSFSGFLITGCKNWLRQELGSTDSRVH